MWTSSSPTRSRFTALCHSACTSERAKWKKMGRSILEAIVIVWFMMHCLCLFLPALTVKSTTLDLVLQVFAFNESLWIKFLSKPVYSSWLAVPAESSAARLAFLYSTLVNHWLVESDSLVRGGLWGMCLCFMCLMWLQVWPREWLNAIVFPRAFGPNWPTSSWLHDVF